MAIDLCIIHFPMHAANASIEYMQYQDVTPLAEHEK